MAIFAPCATAHVVVNVTHVGFATLSGGDAVRSGTWTPVIVDISIVDQASFDGSVRIGQFDSDGDEAYDSVDIHLSAETGGNQRVFLYTLPNRQHGKGLFKVEVRDAEGMLVNVVSQGVLGWYAAPPEPPIYIGDDDLLILEMSTGTIGATDDLTKGDDDGVYERIHHVGHISPFELPELWIGLESVDYIVWDEARVEDLTDRQAIALRKWVERGGVLMIAAGRTASSLRMSEHFRDILPVDIGEVSAVLDLPNVRKVLVEIKEQRTPIEKEQVSKDYGFPKAVTVVQCKVRAGAKVLANEPSADSDVVTARRAGKGRIIFCGISLKDLFSAQGSAARFFQNVFHIRLMNEDYTQPERVSLFGSVAGAVAFSTSGSLFLVIASVFSIGYVLLSTVGTWSFLGLRGWRQHSWSAFAVVGLIASFISIVAVNWLQGIGERLHQLSIVDTIAGESVGHATILFGLRSGSDTRMDVWLPSDRLTTKEPEESDCFLRPLPSGTNLGEVASSYIDPGVYQLSPSTALVRNVRLRATLKRFEGRWDGPLDGQLEAKVSVWRRGPKDPFPRITDDSFVINNLGVDLTGCYLIHTAVSLSEADSIRSQNIFAYPIGDLPASELPVKLAPRCYQPVKDETIVKAMQRRSLANAQTQWSTPLRSIFENIGRGQYDETVATLGQEQNALLLLSTIGEFDGTLNLDVTAQMIGSRSWSRDRFRQLDLGDELTTDSVMLIGFSRTPGPARLMRRRGDQAFSVVTPDPAHSMTMYRIQIPVEILEKKTTETQDDT